jgi:hypothetical protein
LETKYFACGNGGCRILVLRLSEGEGDVCCCDILRIALLLLIDSIHSAASISSVLVMYYYVVDGPVLLRGVRKQYCFDNCRPDSQEETEGR